MGSVWRANHIRLDQHVAVTFIARDIVTPQLAKRFLREAKATASMRHRNVVSVIDFGTAELGVPYLVMEWLDGEAFDARLDRDPPLPVATLVELVAEVLSGLQAVHEAHVVHRDLKPSNIYLVKELGKYYPKIVDFGVSRLQTQLQADHDGSLTESGQIVGTPMYMAPELLRGSKHASERAATSTAWACSSTRRSRGDRRSTGTASRT